MESNDTLPLKVLYVEDEPYLRERVGIVLEMHFDKVLTACNGREGLDTFLRERADIVVSDINMPVMDGLEMTQRIRETAPDVPVIICTAFTETAYLLKAIELGVCAYVRKPLDSRQLMETITHAATPILQRIELERARQREKASLGFILGESPAMREVIRQVQKIAATGFSIILQGETGVGKSHLAALIHGMSARKDAPFVPVALGSIPESLVESELFGHARGAFTGAVRSRKGLFEAAHGGTLFLDDVDCAPPAIQAKLLRAVEEKRFYPVGSTVASEVDTRIIAASNRDLFKDTREGRFREDLCYRLGDLVLTVPPLRERIGDIPVLARTFLLEAALELNRVPPRIQRDVETMLARHPWPGNVRELKSAMKRAALFAGETLTAEALSRILFVSDREVQTCSPRLQTLDELEQQAVRQALDAADGNKTQAARLLDVEYRRFKRMLEKYGL
ncbi:MAG: sigma-54-dependent Fis family transcriptional regulator [Deltaproteobacteria bacterium]|nr:sigma-54-dependent Fis family transcriptional regulator [Deltaproteobacteria bacterium]